MAQKRIEINGKDFTDWFAPYDESVSYIKVKGQNEGLMLDGSYTEDVIAIKAVFSRKTQPMPEETLNTLLQTLLSGIYARVSYFDPRKNAYRYNVVMQYEITETVHRGTGSDGKEYWTGLTVTFTDRFSME